MMRRTTPSLSWSWCATKPQLRLDPRVNTSAASGRLDLELQRLRTEAYLQQVLGAVQALQERMVGCERAFATTFKQQPTNSGRTPPPSAASTTCANDQNDTAWRDWEVLRREAAVQTSELLKRLHEEGSRCMELQRRLDEQREEPHDAMSVKKSNPNQSSAIAALRERLRTVEKELASKDKLIDELRRQSEELTKEQAEQEKAFGCERAQSENNLKAMRSQCEKLAAHNARLSELQQGLTAENHRLRSEATAHRRQIEVLTEQVKTKNDAFAALLRSQAGAKAERDLAEANVNELRSRCKELEAHNERLSKQTDVSSQEKEILNEDNQRLKSENAELLERIARGGERERQLAAQLVFTRASLEERGAEVATALERLTQIRDEREQALAERDRAHAEGDAAAAELKSAKEAEENLAATVASLRAELASKMSTDKRLAEEKQRLWSAWPLIGGLTPPSVAAKDPIQLLQGQDRLASVLRVLTRSLRRSSSSVDPEFVTLGALWYMLSAALERASAVVLADHVYTRRHCLENAVRCDPSLAAAWSELASLAGEGGVEIGDTRFSREALLIKAVECDWDNLEGWLDLAAHLVRLPTPKAWGSATRLPTATLMGAKYFARDILLKVLHSSPTNSRAWMLLGDSMSRPGSHSHAVVQGKQYTASQCHQQAILLDPTNAEAGRG